MRPRPRSVSAAPEATFRALGDYGGLNWTFAVLAWVRFLQGRRDEAERLALEQLPESETTGNRWVTAILQMLLGNIALWSGRATTAVERATGAVQTMTELGDPWGTGQAVAVRVRALAAAGPAEESRAEIDAAAAREGDPNSSLAQMLRVQVLTATGSSDALAAALHLTPSFFDHERRVCVARSLLQAGRVDEAVAELAETAEQVTDLSAGPGAAVRSAYALALVAAGRLDDAAEHVAAGVQGTYLDSLQLDLAAACLAVRRRAPDALARFDAVVDRIDTTEAALEQAIARIARAHAHRAVGSPRADEVRADADRLLATLGLSMPGWETTFRLATAS